MSRLPFAVIAAALLTSSAALAAQSNVKIVLVNAGGVEIGTDAYQGFRTAAKFWEQHLTTSVLVTIRFQVGFDHLGKDVLGGTSSNYDAEAVADVANRIAVLGSGAFDASVHLPNLVAGGFGPATALQMKTPGYTGTGANGPYGIDNATSITDIDGGINNSVIALTTANGKALGYDYGDIFDANITFSSDFAFDFDPKNGIASGTADFVGVATHEMGHALGFLSGVDNYDILGTGGPYANSDLCGIAGGCKNTPANDIAAGQTIDLFRYSAPGVLDWTTNTASYFSIDGGLTAYQGGYFSTGEFTGDGSQASHWKAPLDGLGNPACAPLLGVLNPYFCGGVNGIVTGLDLAGLDAIGWNTDIDVSNFHLSTADFGAFVPEPATWALMIGGFSLIGVALRRQRRIGYATA